MPFFMASFSLRIALVAIRFCFAKPFKRHLCACMGKSIIYNQWNMSQPPPQGNGEGCFVFI